MGTEKASVNGNPSSRMGSPSHERYVPPHIRNRGSPTSNVCVPPAPVPSAAANPSSGSGLNRDIGPGRRLLRRGSWSGTEKSKESRDEKPVWGEKPSGGTCDREVKPLANDLKADDLDQENTGIKVTISGVNMPHCRDTFAEMDLGHALNRNIQRYEFAEPTTLQKYAIPILLAGRDLMACAQNGSGKTAAFCFPIIAGIQRSDARGILLALILSPTIESSCQIHEEATKFAYQTGIKVVVDDGRAPDQVWGSVHILVATPARLADLLEKGRVSLSMVKYLALDEADRMLDMEFEPQIRKIVEQMPKPSAGERQTLLFSATFSKEIERLASDFLCDYISLVVGEVGSSTGLTVHSRGTSLIHSSRENIEPVNKPPGDCSKKFHPHENHFPFGYFDGASKGQNCGCGVILVLSPECRYDLCWNAGTGFSTMAEILALWGLLWFANRLCLKKIRIYGDCAVVIKHMRKKSHIIKEPLPLWLEIINHLKKQVAPIFRWVPRVLNKDADRLSNKGLKYKPGTMHYSVMREGGNKTSSTVELPAFFGYSYCCSNCYQSHCF